MTRTSKGGLKEKRLRSLIIILALVTLAVILPAVRYGPRVYSRWEQHRLMGQARSLLEQKDYRKAALALRRVAELNPLHLEASRMMADIADKAGRSEALALRERVSVLAPDSFDDAYAWASVALRYKDIARVQDALAIMKRTGPDRAEYAFTNGRLSRELGQLPQARQAFQKALQIDPKNNTIRFEAALLDLQADNAPVQQAAEKVLQEFRTVPEHRLQALRALAGYNSVKGNVEETASLAKELVAEKGATFADRLLNLSVLHGTNSPEFGGALNQAQEEARENPFYIAQLVAWANSHNLAMLAREWTGTLPPEQVSAPPIALRVAETCVILKDWARLRTLTGNANWREMEHMRLTFLSRAAGELGDQADSDVQWKAAIAAVAKQPEKLDQLSRTAAAWKWQARWENLLWYMAESSKRPRPPLQELATHYARLRDTRNLLRALTALHDLDPEEVALKNNWAMASLLMRTDVPKAAKAADELYQAQPTNPQIVATHALALYLSNNTDEALAAMKKLPPEKLEIPAVALYYGLLLSALDDPNAAKYLELGKKAKLLPEEEQLAAKANRFQAGQ